MNALLRGVSDGRRGALLVALERPAVLDPLSANGGGLSFGSSLRRIERIVTMLEYAYICSYVN